MRKLKTAGLLTAALVLAGGQALAAQDTSYTRMPVPVDTAAVTNPITPDTTADPVSPANPAIADSIADSLRSDTLSKDVAPRDTGAVTSPPRDSLGVGAEGRVSADSGSTDAAAEGVVKPKEVQPVVPDSTR
jgi:hypothetical protein